MLKTTFTGKSRLGLLLCLTGLLSFVSVTAARAQNDPSAYDDQGATYNNGNNGDDRPYDNSNAGPSDDDADQASPDAQDPPSRVARLSYFDGSVSMQPGGSGDWAAAAKNRPVTIGDKLWTDKDSRAELQAGEASIHLGSMTALSFLNLDQNITQMRLAEGSINFRVRELREGDQYEVDTPNAAFTVRQAGAFRIDVNEQGDGTLVTVIRGEGEVTAGGKTYSVRPGELAELNGNEGNVEYKTERAPDADDLDRWALERDRKEENSISARYVSRDTVGYSDLDDNGTWNDEPEYGHVWYPNTVSVGWAPYSYGYWSWVGPWGWTWVDYSPWGFAPFHYGRWHYFGSRWGWCPGPIGGYPVYGPAFVGFIGGHRGFSFGVGIGVGVGWFPLGYGEIYHPWYRYRAGGVYIRNINVRNTYIRNVNVINTRVGTTRYAYARNPAAVTAVSHSTFVNGQLINRGNTRVSASVLRNASVTNRVGATPTRASYVGAVNARGRVATPPASVQNRAVIARTAPAPAASHMPVRTVPNTGTARGFGNRPLGNTAVNNGVNNRGAVNNRQLSTNRPATAQGNRTVTNDNLQQRIGNNGNRPATNYQNRSQSNTTAPSMRNRSDRPNFAGQGSANTQGSARINNNRPPATNNNRSYDRGASSAPRTYSPPQRTYSDRGGSSAPRTYSAPPRGGDRGASSAPRTYSAPAQRSAPAPSRAPSGGSRPSGGSSSHGNSNSHGSSSSHGSNPHGRH